ncbi:MAG TPA: hypothetical protein VLS89_02485, partial [Candidatus Nanopelagicales bacterium]|nr:hypothetical protein [Candidatus Nanopelagicales bacterium]
MRRFLEHFDFDTRSWSGPHASRFKRREDVFQQLVGEALREALPGSVRIAPTEGQDGTIDVFIEGDARLPWAPAELPGPIVVECKDNDDKRSRVTENVLASWREVKKKLEKKAAESWSGTYQPWRSTRSFLFVTSAVLPHQQARNKLEREITDFFQELRRSGQCAVEQTVLVDWTDLRGLLDAHQRLADRWLGVGTDPLRAHDEVLAGLIGFSRYLVDLEYVAPEQTSPTHPDRLLERVQEMAVAGRGVLLTGAGGVGKTRTLYEVATRGGKAGWRVLHIIPGTPGLQESKLVDEIITGGANTLIICDYLERTPLDLASVQRHLVPEATQRKLRVAFLASARSGQTIRRIYQQSAGFFEVVDLA